MTPSTLNMNLKILVPQGAEHRAVLSGIRQSRATHSPTQAPPGPTVIPIPIGPDPVRRFLESVQTGNPSISAPFQPEDAILLMGLGGSLSPELDIGAVTLLEHCHADYLTNAFVTQTHLPDHPPLPDRLEDQEQPGVTSDRPLLQWVHQLLNVPVTIVRGVTTTRIISSACEKAQLHQSYNAAIVDMEGYRVLEFCRAQGIRGAVLRVVGDRSDQTIPDLNHAISPQGTLRTAPLIWGLVKNPIAATHFVRGSLAGLKMLRATASLITTAYQQSYRHRAI